MIRGGKVTISLRLTKYNLYNYKISLTLAQVRSVRFYFTLAVIFFSHIMLFNQNHYEYKVVSAFKNVVGYSKIRIDETIY